MLEYIAIFVIYFFIVVFCMVNICYCCQKCCEIDIEEKMPEARAVERTDSMESVNVVIEITENNMVYG